MPLTQAQRKILSAPPVLGQQETELLQNHTSSEPWAIHWQVDRLQEVRDRNNDQGARYLAPREVLGLLIGTPLGAEAKWHIHNTTLTVLGSKPVLGNQPVEGYDPGARIIFMAQGELERSLHVWAHVFAFDYFRQDSSIGSAFMEALYSWVVRDWWWIWPMRFDSLFRPRSARLRVWRLAQEYIYGSERLPGGFWKDGAWAKKDVEEAFASLFSACRADLALLPPSLRVYYRGMASG